MKFNIKKELLLKGIYFVEKNIGRNLSLPVLNNILIKTNKNNLDFISTDLEIGVLASIPAKIEKQGSIVISPKTLSSFLNTIPEGTIEVKIEKNTLFIKQNDYKTSINGTDDSEFPLMPRIKKDVIITLPSRKIVKGLGQVVNSVSNSDLKPELTGVFFSLEKDTLKLAATDSFRLSEKSISIDYSKKPIKLILPAKTVSEVVRIFQNLNEDIEICIDDNQISFENKNKDRLDLRVLSKLIEGDYPSYAQIIPKEFNTKTILSKKDFIQQIRAGSFFASRINDIKIKIVPKKIEINTKNTDVGEYTSAVTAATEGEQKEMAFNYHYLLDGLNNLEDDEVLIKSNKKDGPVVFEGTKHKDYFYILMPIRGH